MKNGKMRRLFVAATKQNDGKTSCSLGLVKGFKNLASVGFIKPVGQRYVNYEDVQVDEDAVLVYQACKLSCSLKQMNPVVIPQYFTRQYLEDPDSIHPRLVESIETAFTEISKDKELMVIEGTGHAGVGSVFDLSNARVAKLLDAKAVIVTLGGIGQPIDEVTVNLSLFEKEKVPVIGVIANKVMPQKLEQTKHYLTGAFERIGLPLLGVIPYTSRLTWPTMHQIAESLHAPVLNGHEFLSNAVADVIIGAMTSQNALKYIQDRTLLILPGDRDDIALAVLTLSLLRKDVKLSGIVFTDGLMPQPQTMDLICCTDIPVLSVEMRTYETAAKIHDIAVKIRVTDNEKIDLVASNIRENIDLGELWSLLG